MNDFVYSYPVKVYFGTDAAQKAISQELDKYGNKIMLAYGGGSVKRSGVYDAVTEKRSWIFPELCPIPHMQRCRRARKW